ncbi:MAG: ComEA family DNA-binding protein [Gammaproteobacteria bacterium]|nr:ComEA family DNA-binding protein [Gammaproteobacteria bacterium]
MKIRTLLLTLMLMFSGVAFSSQIDINTANADAIAKTLKGVGPSKAAAIVQYRENNGPFFDIQDLAKVKGIGLKTLEVNKEKIRFASDK